MNNGTSQFSYEILEDIVTLDVNIEWDDDGCPTIDEITIDGLDVTEEILSYGLSAKLIQYALDNEDCFVSGEQDHAEFCEDCRRNED